VFRSVYAFQGYIITNSYATDSVTPTQTSTSSTLFPSLIAPICLHILTSSASSAVTMLFKKSGQPDSSVMSTPSSTDKKKPSSSPQQRCKSSTTANQTVRVSTNLELSGDLRVNTPRLYKIPLTPINCGFGIVSENDEAKILLRPMTRRERRFVHQADVTVLFAIRRPGCGACREHASQLSELAQEDKKVCVVGAIKHIGVDDAALLEFYREYFHYPIYKDEKWDLYKALGDRQIKVWNLLTQLPKMIQRLKQKNIKNVPFGGDMSLTQGGVLIFDRNGNLRYAYLENYGDELNLTEIKAAIEAARIPLDGDETSEELT
jgi:thiol-disulfide isomerase/thioredoxin